MRAIYLDDTLASYKSGMRLWAYIKVHHRNSSLKFIFPLTTRKATENMVLYFKRPFYERLRGDDFSAVLKILVSKATSFYFMNCISKSFPSLYGLGKFCEFHP